MSKNDINISDIEKEVEASLDKKNKSKWKKLMPVLHLILC